MGAGPFLVACGGGAKAAVDGTFDGVAFLVVLAVESGGPTAAGTAVMAVSALVEPFGDGVRYAASAQVAADFAGRVGLVGQDMGGAGARLADSDAGHRYLLDDGLQLGASVVTGCQEEGEWPASYVGCEVDFGGEAAAGASQTLADLTTSSSRTLSFRSTGSAWFVRG